MNSASEIKIIIADAQPVFREGLKHLLSAQHHLQIVSEACNSRELMSALNSHQPDILILDYNPAYFEGEKLTEALSALPECKVIIISSQEKKWNIFKSLEFNVYCYLTKECGKQDIYTAVNAAAKGEKFFCTFIVDVLLGNKSEHAPIKIRTPHCLTERELQIIRLIAQGKLTKEIAAQLHLSQHTVHTHRKNIMKKLGVHSAVELSNYAIANGLLE